LTLCVYGHNILPAIRELEVYRRQTEKNSDLEEQRMNNIEREIKKKLIVGCFALIEPFRSMADQFRLIRQMGIEYADLTDNHNGGMLGVEYGFTASVSLDSHDCIG
jgi:hypothetical protein